MGGSRMARVCSPAFAGTCAVSSGFGTLLMLLFSWLFSLQYPYISDPRELGCDSVQDRDCYMQHSHKALQASGILLIFTVTSMVCFVSKSTSALSVARLSSPWAGGNGGAMYQPLR